jgi:DeoR family fructose operon transcriptional repressor
VKLLQQSGRIDAGSVAERFGITLETVRRDLIALESDGVVLRVHGGAVLAERRMSLPGRVAMNADHKNAIAHAAMAYIPRVGAILLDAGSTVGRLAEVWPGGDPLIVVTNALPAAMTLVTKPSVVVHTLGGRVGPVTLDEVGTAALQALSQVSVDVAFIGADGMSLSHGFSSPDHAQSATKRAMIDAAKRSIVLADSSKFGVDYFSRIATLREADLLITDEGADPAFVDEFRAAGLDVLIAPPVPHE